MLLLKRCGSLVTRARPMCCARTDLARSASCRMCNLVSLDHGHGHRSRSSGHIRCVMNSRALGVGLAFGHAEAETLIALAESASAHGARAVRPAPGRALLLIGIAEQDVTASAHEAARLGFVTRADDPRRRIVACPGAPACASGFIAARKLALEFADLLGSHILQGKDLMHISGCAKGCAHPQPAALTIVGSERGCGIVEHGTARATPHTYVDPRQLAAHLAQRIDEPVHG